jgi:hypothetical protein
MKIEKGAAPGEEYYTVSFDKGELVVDSGRSVPYPSWAGTIRIDQHGRVKYNVWTPAAYVPRGYKKAAKRFLEQAVLKQFGRL